MQLQLILQRPDLRDLHLGQQEVRRHLLQHEKLLSMRQSDRVGLLVVLQLGLLLLLRCLRQPLVRQTLEVQILVEHQVQP